MPVDPTDPATFEDEADVDEYGVGAADDADMAEQARVVDLDEDEYR
ncbi:hypothetical protein QOM21_02380 [Streptomyces sp. Pv4-95]